MNVGIVGGGQLAWMLALAGHPLGLRFTFLDPNPDACAASLGTHLLGAYDDQDMLRRLAASSDVVTYEFENVPESAIAYLSEHTAVNPGMMALKVARDRCREKKLFRELGLPTAKFRPIDDIAGLHGAINEIGLPAVLKTRTLGYDGKGQAVLRNARDVDAAWKKLGNVPLILESFVEFEREVSIIAVRGQDGAMKFYPLTENKHREGILRVSYCRPGDVVQFQAEQYVRKLLDSLNYVGVLALELFQVGKSLLVNEMAPRIHNSGHWTIEGAAVSQFEQHLRAILGMPLGDTRVFGHAGMVNFIGTMPPMAKVLAVPGVRLHDYGKQPKPGRKLGHATVVAANEVEMDSAVSELLALT